ncbi:hypothetical protein [Xanthomonas arboricola]|uniref:Uncharacterized protein n=1 Tax=Xanthomonas arboricola TaxID=56448 RepID=A0AB73H348_9XANT|nr:hypothetical protein [Xanthomonas arboricola]MBB5672608.1 hypothetical protein [Xanthomonas arboricola]
MSPPKIPTLLLLNRRQKKALLETHGYHVMEGDTESDLDFTIREDVAKGDIKVSDIERAIGS